MRELLKNITSKFNYREAKELQKTIEMQDREYDLIRTELCKKNGQIITLETQIRDLEEENAILLERKNKYLSQVKKLRLELKKVANEE